MKEILKTRFENNLNRHKEVNWETIEVKITSEHIKKLSWMEETGGEPDIFCFNNKIFFVDFAKESPNRRSVCYDQKSRMGRKKFPPESSALELCQKNNLDIIDEQLYTQMQSIENIDTKTSSWLKTPDQILNLGGALTGEKRFGRTFIGANGSDSYYSTRSFRTYFEI